MINLAKQLKKYKTLIGVTALVLTACIAIFAFTEIKPKKENEIVNHTKYFQTPDRMVYKVKGKDEYYVYTLGNTDYDILLNQLTKSMEGGIGEGAKLSQEEMKKIEQEESYIELDYDTVSKNYIIAYQKENSNVIKRTDDGGIVVKNKILEEKELEKLLKKQTKNKEECYQMLDNKEYKVLEPISYEVPSWSNELKKYEPGIYSVRLGTKQAWEKFQENNKIPISQEIPEEQFQKTNVVAMITKYPIEKVETRIGGITFYFTGEENTDKYYVNVYCFSKAINSNCIYRNFNGINQKENTAERIEGILTKIEGNTYWIQNEKLETKKLILENQKIINNRTEKEMTVQEIQEQDKIQISKAIQNEEEIFLKEESNIRVTRNIKGEALKKELLDAQEVSMTIEKLTEQGNKVLLTGRITDYYSELEQANFEVQVAVDKDTQIFSTTKNQLEELQKMEERGDTIFVTFRDREKEQGRLVAQNIEVMGC